MAYTVKEALNFVYPHIWQNGASRLINTNQIMFAMNHALNMIYNYEWYIWSWTQRKDAFAMNWTVGSLLSRWPVRKVDKFWTTKFTDVDRISEDPCVCPIDPPADLVKPCCECSCKATAQCKPLILDQILPQNNLCDNQYQISWSFTAGQGGLDGRILKVKLAEPTDVLWVSYFAGPVKLEKLTDIVPLPDSYMHVLGWIIAAMVVPLWGASRAQEDLNLHSLYRKELDYLRKIDNIHPKEVVFDSPNSDINKTPFIPNVSVAWLW